MRHRPSIPMLIPILAISIPNEIIRKWLAVRVHRAVANADNVSVGVVVQVGLIMQECMLHDHVPAFLVLLQVVAEGQNLRCLLVVKLIHHLLIIRTYALSLSLRQYFVGCQLRRFLKHLLVLLLLERLLNEIYGRILLLQFCLFILL